MVNMHRGTWLSLTLCFFAGLVCSVTDDSTRSCTSTKSVFDSIRVLNANGESIGLTGNVYDDFQTGTTRSGICQLERSCCSSEAERSFKDYVVKHYRDKVIGQLSGGLMGCHNHSITEEMSRYFLASKADLVSSMLATYNLYFRPYVTIFDHFYDYLVTTIRTGDTCQLAEEWNKVFFDVYLAAYFGFPSTRTADQLPNTDEFIQCFFNLFLEDNKQVLSLHLNAMLRSYNQTMYYLRALKRLDSVIVATVDYVLNDRCQSSIMKMTHCANCAGYSESPCNDLCLNVMRGCLVDLSDMFTPLERFSEALIKLENTISERNGLYYLWGQMNMLHSYFFMMVSETFGQAIEIETKVLTSCDANGPINPVKRQAPSGGSPRTPRVVVPPPIATLNHSSYCLSEALPTLMQLPTAVCDSERTAESGCWNGKTLGSYGRSVLEFDRKSQANNPELVVKPTLREIEQQIVNLEVATKEMNIRTGNHGCSRDDEDCVSTVPDRCRYFDLVDVPLPEIKPEGSGCMSGDGSGEGSGSGCPDVTSAPPTGITGTTNTVPETTPSEIVTETPTTPIDIITAGPGTGPGTTRPTEIITPGPFTGPGDGDDNNTGVPAFNQDNSASFLNFSLATVVIVALCSILLL